MFSKLLKYEWKANSGLLSILSLAAVGAGIFGGVILRIIIYISEINPEEDLWGLSVAGLGILLFFMVLALIAYVLAVQFVTISRFYKNKFTDEGYLTFTLPVNVHQIFVSSLLNVLIWLVISAVVLLTSISLIVIIGAGEHLSNAMHEITIGLGFIQNEMASYPGYGAYKALTAVQMLAAPIYSVILIMSCITTGSVLSKKHKVLTTVALYYGVTTALSIVTFILTAVPQILLLTAVENYEQNLYLYTNISLGINLGLQVLVAVGAYFLSAGLMKHKLNLS